VHVQGHKPLPALLIRHAGNRARPIAEDAKDRLFHFEVRHHFAGDLAETREAVRDGEKASVIQLCDIAGDVPAVTKNIGRALRLVEVSHHAIRSLHQQEALCADGERFERDRVGDTHRWLEACPELGRVFLDELGDMDPAIQVKLLRVIETRTFHPVGDTASREFAAKLIAATNRRLEEDMRAGRFREDLYYRLCSDQIVTPSLAEQLADSPQVLSELVSYLSRRVAGEDGSVLAGEVMDWIVGNLPANYAWPGNYRELEQCVKNVLIRRNYRPSRMGLDPVEEFVEDARAVRLTANHLLSRYATIVYSRCGSYEETARRLELDRRTVKAKVDGAMLERLRLF